VHAYGVCDDEDYFYDYIDSIYSDMGATPDRIGAAALPMTSHLEFAAVARPQILSIKEGREGGREEGRNEGLQAELHI
jgi:hypothetical protein